MCLCLICLWAFISVYIYICIYMHVCMYIYIYIYINIRHARHICDKHTHIYIHVHVYTPGLISNRKFLLASFIAAFVEHDIVVTQTHTYTLSCTYTPGLCLMQEKFVCEDPEEASWLQLSGKNQTDQIDQMPLHHRRHVQRIRAKIEARCVYVCMYVCMYVCISLPKTCAEDTSKD